MFKKFFPTQASLAEDFVDKVYGSGASMAEIQGYFMLHKHDANSAIKDAPFFAKAMSEKHKRSPFSGVKHAAAGSTKSTELFDKGVTNAQEDSSVSDSGVSTASYDYSDPGGIKKSRTAAVASASRSPRVSSGATKVKPIVLSDTSPAAREAVASIHATNEAMRKSMNPESR